MPADDARRGASAVLGEQVEGVLADHMLGGAVLGHHAVRRDPGEDLGVEEAGDGLAGRLVDAVTRFYRASDGALQLLRHGDEVRIAKKVDRGTVGRVGEPREDVLDRRPAAGRCEEERGEGVLGGRNPEVLLRGVVVDGSDEVSGETASPLDGVALAQDVPPHGAWRVGDALGIERPDPADLFAFGAGDGVHVGLVGREQDRPLGAQDPWHGDAGGFAGCAVP